MEPFGANPRSGVPGAQAASSTPMHPITSQRTRMTTPRGRPRPLRSTARTRITVPPERESFLLVVHRAAPPGLALEQHQIPQLPGGTDGHVAQRVDVLGEIDRAL